MPDKWMSIWIRLWAVRVLSRKRFFKILNFIGNRLLKKISMNWKWFLAAWEAKKFTDFFYSGNSWIIFSGIACTGTLSKGIRCKGHLTSRRWFFDTVSSKCVIFQYSGCNPGANNFFDRYDCEKYCSDSRKDKGMLMSSGVFRTSCFIYVKLWKLWKTNTDK